MFLDHQTAASYGQSLCLKPSAPCSFGIAFVLLKVNQTQYLHTLGIAYEQQTVKFNNTPVLKYENMKYSVFIYI